MSRSSNDDRTNGSGIGEDKKVPAPPHVKELISPTNPAISTDFSSKKSLNMWKKKKVEGVKRTISA